MRGHASQQIRQRISGEQIQQSVTDFEEAMYCKNY